MTDNSFWCKIYFDELALTFIKFTLFFSFVTLTSSLLEISDCFDSSLDDDDSDLCCSNFTFFCLLKLALEITTYIFRLVSVDPISLI